MTWLVSAWLLLASVTWAGLLAGIGRWGRGWTMPEPASAPPVPGPVRVCVPARDEEGRVGACVSAVLASRGVDLELVVADDHSTDRTAAEAQEAGEGDPRLRGVSAPPRPAGWSGKAWACATAAEGASAPWLLFLDADVRVHPLAVAAAVSRAAADRADLLSLFGSWELVGAWERIALPAVGWLVRGAVDLERVNGDDPGAPAFANGQLLLVRREAYQGWGGHRAVRGEVLDDVRLAQRARSAGARLRLLHAPWAFRVRLYRDLGEIVAGYRKNLLEGAGGRRGALVAGAVAVLLTTVLPPVAAPLLWLAGHPLLASWALGVTLAAVAFRWLLERRDGRPGVVAPLHPVAGAVLAWVLLAAVVGRRARWKGRNFLDGQAESSGRPPPGGGGRRGGGAGDETRTRDD